MECIIPRRRQDSFVQSLENCVVEFKLETQTTIALWLGLFKVFLTAIDTNCVASVERLGQLWFLRFKSIEILSEIFFANLIFLLFC